MPKNSLRLVFAGTPDFAARHLAGLLTAGYQPLAVYTQPDRPAGRGKKLTASPVKQYALEAGLRVMQPATLKSEDAQAELAALRADVLIVVAYGLILPGAVLDTPRVGCINVHASLLPRWRGAAPIQRAIEAGDPETGITIMKMDEGLDTGPLLASESVPITAATTAADLHDRLAEVGVPLLLRVLDNLEATLGEAREQDDSKATYASKIDKQEVRLRWERPAVELERQIRAFNPFPICWTTLAGQRLKIWRAEPCEGQGAPGTILSADEEGITVACGEDALRITLLQLAGGRPLEAAELLRSKSQLFHPQQQLGA